MRIQDGIVNQILTLIKPQGKELSLKPGEIIEAQVVDLFPGGGLTLKVKDSYLPVRSDFSFNLQETIFLKVLGQGDTGNDLILQLVPSKSPLSGSSPQINQILGRDNEQIGILTQKILDHISQFQPPSSKEVSVPVLQPSPSSDLIRFKGLWEELLRALPSSLQTLSKETLAQIQKVLLVSTPIRESLRRDPSLELIIQLIQNKVESGEDSVDRLLPEFNVTKVDDLVRKVSDQILKMISPDQEALPERMASSPTNFETGKLKNLLEDLLKSLPKDIQVLPKGLRSEIQILLQTSLKEMDENIPQKIINVLNGLPEGSLDSFTIQSLKDNLLSLQRLNAAELKAVVEDSGVVLEAKLKAMVEGLPQNGQGKREGNPPLQNDLKGILLQLKELLEEKLNQNPSLDPIQRWLGGRGKGQGEDIGSLPKELEGVETLLKDVQTFQLLSKVTDSFYTFLPAQWVDLKRGELVFKRRRLPTGEASYSCGIHLDLERVGTVSVFIYMQQRDFFVTFKVDHADLDSLIKAHLEELRTNFRKEGLNLKSFSSQLDQRVFPDPSERIASEETLVSIRI